MIKSFCSIIALFIAFSIIQTGETISQELKWRAITNAPADTSSRFEDCYFINGNTGWIIHIEGIAYKTTDAGQSWSIDFTDAGNLFRSITFSDSQNGWIGTLGLNPLYHTTDGGLNWSVVSGLPFGPDSTGICGMYSVNSDVVYGCGRYFEPARVIKTTNGGTNWSSINMNGLANTLIDCYFISPDSGFVVGGIGEFPNSIKSRVLFTSDGGSTWDVRFTGTREGEWCWKISFPSENTGYVSVERVSGTTLASVFLKTTDGGLTWTENPFISEPFDQEGIGFVNDTLGWLGGWGDLMIRDGPTYKTTDGGSSWELDDFGRNINRFRFISDTLAYAVGKTVYKYSRDSTVGISTISSEIPEGYSMSQNYPNPFNPVTKIKFNIPKSSFVRLAVYNILGKEVGTLVSRNLDAGVYEADFDGSNLSSGVYFYKLVTEDFTDIKKMILSK